MLLKKHENCSGGHGCSRCIYYSYESDEYPCVDCMNPDCFYNDGIAKIETSSDKYNPISNPKHYNSHPSGIECIEIAKHHDFCIGNAIKYLWRAGLKDVNKEIEDLKKAIYYIECKMYMLEGKNVKL